MKNLVKFFAVALLGIAAACNEKELAQEPVSEEGGIKPVYENLGTVSFTAQFENKGTKGYDAQGKVKWEVGDYIIVAPQRRNVGGTLEDNVQWYPANDTKVVLTSDMISADGKTATFTIDGLPTDVPGYYAMSSPTLHGSSAYVDGGNCWEKDYCWVSGMHTGGYVNLNTFTEYGALCKPHLSYANCTVSDTKLTFKNVGTSATDGTTTVSLSCNDDNLTILDGTASFESLAPETTVQVGGFRYIIAEGVADGTRFIINTTAVCGSNTWEGRATITAGEAVLQFDGMANPGGFVPGETISIIASFKNAGHYKATNAIATVTSTSPYVSFVNDSFEVGTLDPTGIAYCVFNVTIDANCPVTEQLPLTITLNADGGLTAEGSGIIKNSCNVIFELTDSWGDGWNGNYLNVSFSDGTPSQNLTIENGNSETYVIEIGHGVHVTLSWISGQYTYECSFVVRYEDGDEICQATSPNTNYSFEFDCNCSAGAPVGTFNPVEDLQAEATETGVTLAWNAPEGAINYIIYRNGIEIAQTSETTYTDNIISKDGFYTYCVVAEYAEGASVPDCVIIEFLDAISENEAEFAIYPNPVNNTLFVNCGNAEFNYEMFNGMGQKVASGNATGNAQICVNDMTKGIYFLRLTSGTQVRMEKVVVE